MKNTVFINVNLYQFDINDFEYIGIKKISDIQTDSDNILMLKSLYDYETVEVAFNFFNKIDNKNYYFLINDFGFIKCSNNISEKYNLLPIIDEYHEASLIVYNYRNFNKIDIDHNDIQIHHKEGVRICTLNSMLQLLQKYYPETHSSFIDEMDDFSFKMTIKKNDLKDVDKSMMEKLSKQFNVKESKNGNKEFYKLKFSYEK